MTDNSTNKMQPVRGTKDLFPEEYAAHMNVVRIATKVASLHGYLSMSTPILEFTEIFNRTLGDCSDIVTKEMYSFEDRGGERLTMRPEFTAAIARAFISGGLHHQLPLKFFTHGPLFRYERPQKGRLRQFHQINAECLGPATPFTDSEMIAMGAMILQKLGILDSTRLEINSLGDAETRGNYHQALTEYLHGFKKDLSEDSKIRLDKNPLRILDSKDEGDKAIIAKAPKIDQYFSKLASDFFAEVKAGLDAMKIEYQVNPYLVRGLDYYSHTAFEFITDKLGAQGTVLAGGRYDGLISKMGGPAVPAVGFAAGIERLSSLVHFEPKFVRQTILLPISNEANLYAIALAANLRQLNIPANCDFEGNVNKKMKRANKINAKFAIFIGAEELANNCLTVKNLDTGQETKLSEDKLAIFLMNE
jgi:histidyl-tRNA synthetase